MKQFLLLLLIVTLSSCIDDNSKRGIEAAEQATEQNKSKPEVPQERPIGTYKSSINPGGSKAITQNVVEFDGMYFAIISTGDGYISTINLTKESLEIQLLKKQLK